MHNFLRFCLSFLFPPSSDEVLVSHLSKDSLDALLYPQERDGIISLFSYENKNIRALIWQAKYRRDEKAFRLLGSVLGEYLREFGPVTLIPIPLSRARLRERGYNQAYEIAKYAAEIALCDIRTEVLFRTRDTKRQTELSRAERLTNLKDVFAVERSETLSEKRIVLLDDVTTTGTTLKEAAKALYEAGISHITLIALARAK